MVVIEGGTRHDAPMSSTTERVARTLSVRPAQVDAVVELTTGGATVPFIARYRKERTDGLDETQIRAVIEEYTRLNELDARRETIVEALRKAGQLSSSLSLAITRARTKGELEDLYAPYRQKRKTRADVARERGLGVVAERLLQAPPQAVSGVVEECGLEEVTPDEAVAGAVDIVAETVSRAPEVRTRLNDLTERQAAIVATRSRKGSEQGGIPTVTISIGRNRPAKPPRIVS